MIGSYFEPVIKIVYEDTAQEYQLMSVKVQSERRS